MIRIAAGVARRDDQVLLVKQQGSDHPEPNWALPGGVVEPGESLVDGLRREVQEETGLRVIRVDRLAWAVELRIEPDDFVHAFVYEVVVSDEVPRARDPDGYVLEARFVTTKEAERLIEATLPWRSMREPLLAYLRGLAPQGTTWFYRQPPGGEEILEMTIPGSDSSSISNAGTSRLPPPRP